MLLVEYPSIGGVDFPYYDKKATWKLLHAYIYVHSQKLIYGYPGDGVQATKILQSQDENMIFFIKADIV